MIFYWVKWLYGLVGRSQLFGEVCCFHLAGLKWWARTVKDNIYRVVGGEVWGKGFFQDGWGRNWAGPMRRLQLGVGRGEDRWWWCGESRRDEVSPLQGPLHKADTLAWDYLHSVKSQIRGFHARLGEEPVPPSHGSSRKLWRWRQHASSKHWLLPTNPHGSLAQKNVIRIVTTVKILNLTFLSCL
jgi:hypothetical protein